MYCVQTKKLIQIWLFILIFSTVSCNTKDEFIPLVFNDISEEFKKYTVFDTASRWIYQNDLTLEKDTLSIIWNSSETRYHLLPDGTDEYNYRAINQYFNINGTGIQRTEITAGSQNSTTQTLYENCRLYLSNNRYYTILAPRYPVNEIQLLGFQEGNYMNLPMIEQLTLNGIIYNNVFHTSVKDYQPAPDTLFLEFWFAREFGLVKMSTRNAQGNITWSLLESDVLPSAEF
ncbi:MAG: hypothetical protein Q8S18_07295 [Bacteroidales bacterium]|nr:hypothetical protein [Bacteroidales bacterium]